MTVLNEIPPHSIYRLKTKGNDVIGVPAVFNEIPVQKWSNRSYYTTCAPCDSVFDVIFFNTMYN